MTIIRLSTIFVIAVVSTKLALFAIEDSKLLDVENEILAELEHEIEEAIDEVVRYLSERREPVEAAECFAAALRRSAVRAAYLLLLEAVRGIRGRGMHHPLATAEVRTAERGHRRDITWSRKRSLDSLDFIPATAGNWPLAA